MILTVIPARSIALTARLRYPSIKFRYGAARDNKTSSAAGAATAASQQQQPGEPIYDFQLPLRFRRKLIEQEEIDYINRGGPA